ncbi:MAG: serine/threonine protein phosphatase [Tannerella sp.]|nr:serine/threonine protein phosphatase [Tannerella sp.]
MRKQILCIVIAWFAGTAGAVLAQQIPSPRRADPQHLTDPDAFTLILLGDPQGYTKYDVNQPIFDLCTAWIADHIELLHIRGVLCTGDLVEQNENIVPQRHTNQTSRQMWEAASRAFARLDNKVPYIISCGNHDYGYLHSENSLTRFPEYFPIERNPAWKGVCVDAIPNRNGIPSMENAAFEFKDDRWGNLLVITSEFYPRDEVLEWAKQLAAGDSYRHHTVIFMTHGYMETQKNNARRIDASHYDLEPGNTGVQIWEKLLQPSDNIRLLICGHEATDNNVFAENVAYRADRNRAGKNVHQMMFNVQTLGGGWEGNGGDGWLRILEFMPDGKTVKVRTYSPLFGISPTTRHLAHRNDPYDRFDMVIE